jgi:hypothetical protein
MDKYNLNSVAVVDEGDGSLVANCSGSDLGVFLSGRHSLHMPVLDFFAEVLPFISNPVTPTTTFGRCTSHEVCTTCAGRSMDVHTSRTASRTMRPGHRLLCCGLDECDVWQSRKADLSEKASARSPTVTCTDQDTLQKVIGRCAQERA